MKRWLLSLIASAVFLSLVACTILTGGSNSSKSVEVYLTDAVLPIERVESILVTIDRILLLSDEATVVVSDEATTVNLLELVGDELYLGSVPTGTYGQLRFEISSATITVDGTDHSLSIASESLKYNLQGFEVTAGSKIVLDFDLSRSIKVTGSATSNQHGQNPVQYHMTPVINVRYGQLYDVTGRVVDQNSNGVPHVLVALFETGQPSPTAVTLTHKESGRWQEGEFKLCKVRPGTYELKLYTNWQSSQDPDNIFDTEPATTIQVNVRDQGVDLGDIQINP
ncbi:DUF4382 domain-containing protein [Pseudothermotoga sp.]